jgi:RNA-binding protein 8A
MSASAARQEEEDLDFDEENEASSSAAAATAPAAQPSSPPSAAPSSPPSKKSKTTPAEESESSGTPKIKGRGHQNGGDKGGGGGGHYESREDEEGGGEKGNPARSVEGWVLIVTGLHEEAQEDEVVDRFGEFGEVRNVQMNLDRRTGFVKGYALVEFLKKNEAEKAKEGMDKEEMYGKEVRVDWAFVHGGRGGGGGGGRGGGRR